MTLGEPPDNRFLRTVRCTARRCAGAFGGADGMRRDEMKDRFRPWETLGEFAKYQRLIE